MRFHAQSDFHCGGFCSGGEWGKLILIAVCATGYGFASSPARKCDAVNPAMWQWQSATY